MILPEMIKIPEFSTPEDNDDLNFTKVWLDVYSRCIAANKSRAISISQADLAIKDYKERFDL